MQSVNVIGKLRWRMVVLITAAIAVSYFDRQTLPVAVHAIQRDIAISNTQFSQLQATFLAAYALMYIIGGKLVDTLGTRKGFLVIMLWWSFACASQGLATSVGAFAMSLFALGVGEGGGFPAATKALAEWCAPNEIATAMGVVNGGTAVGAVAAPPLIAVTLAFFSWRWIFFFAGSIGILWTIWWMVEYHPPAFHPGLKADERQEMSRLVDIQTHKKSAISWIRLFRYPQVSGLVIAKFMSDAAWYFYIFWLPKYLYDVHHFDTKQVGYYAWIPYAAAGVGSVLGGWFSSHLMRRGHSLNFSRKIALGVSAGVMPLILFVTHSPMEFVIVLFSIAFAGQQSWSTLVMTLPADIFPTSDVGAVAGLVGCGGASGGIVFGLIVGFMLDHGFGYGAVFACVSTFHILAFCIILLAIRNVQPVSIMPADALNASAT
jgi:MFS transporter, ACS family, aldohexuronate transporter